MIPFLSMTASLSRVGRGRYRKAVGDRAVSAATISDQIERRIGRAKRNVFLRSDISSECYS